MSQERYVIHVSGPETRWVVQCAAWSEPVSPEKWLKFPVLDSKTGKMMKFRMLDHRQIGFDARISGNFLSLIPNR